MEEKAYTLARWVVKEGAESEFIDVWSNKLAPAIRAVNPGARGTLVRSVDEPRLFYSFGPWRDLQEAGKVRTDPQVTEALTSIRRLCAEASPGAFEVVAQVG